MKTHQGPGHLPRPVHRRRPRRSTRSRRSPTGPRAWATWACRSRPGDARAVRPGAGRREPGLLRRDRGHAGRPRPARSPSCRPTCRASWSPCIRPMTRCSTASPPPEVRGKPAARQAWAVEPAEAGRQGQPPPRPHRARDLLRRAGLALLLSLAAAAGGPGRGGVRRARPALAADPRRLRRGGRRRLLRDPSRARTCTTARPSSGSSSEVDDHPRANILYDPSHFVLQQLDYLDFIDLYHDAHQRLPRQGRRVPARTAARASTAAIRAGSTGRAASARWATARSISAAIFSKLAAVRLSRLGGARVGVRAEAPRGRRRAKARPSSATTSSA